MRQFLLPLKRDQWVFFGKVSAVVMLTVASGATWFATISTHVQLLTQFGSYRVAFVYLAVVALCIVAFFLAPFLRSRLLRSTFVSIMVVGYGAEDVAVSATGFTLDSTLLDILWTNVAMGPEAIASYRVEILKTLAWLVPAAVVMLWNPGKWGGSPSMTALIPLAAFASAFAIAVYTKGGTSQFIAPISVPAAFAAVASNGLYRGPRDTVQYNGITTPKISKVVLIIDESIRGDYVGVTDATKNTTPFMLTNRTAFINFGNAVAATNCSVPSRVILRTGLRRDQVPDLAQRALKSTSIWQYAQAAGFKTVYIDGFAMNQNIALSNHSYMSKVERAAIHESVPIDHRPAYERDAVIAEKLLEILSRGEKMFILVEKYGAHFPYPATYPPDFSGTEGPAPVGDLVDPDFLKKSYRLAIQWSVDEFFKRLLPRVNLSDTLILYTSDHGQNLLEDGYRRTHCSTRGEINPSEGNVPLFALTENVGLRTVLRKAASENYDTVTHFEIFPTLLWAMGYDKSWVTGTYGLTVADLHDRPGREFFAGHLFGAIQGWRWVPAGQPTDPRRLGRSITAAP